LFGSLDLPLGTKRSVLWKSFAVNKTGRENRLDPSGRQEHKRIIDPPRLAARRPGSTTASVLEREIGAMAQLMLSPTYLDQSSGSTPLPSMMALIVPSGRIRPR
jgi:hypothetical protein